jgi:outer membrane protein assembly factor BamB
MDMRWLTTTRLGATVLATVLAALAGVGTALVVAHWQSTVVASVATFVASWLTLRVLRPRRPGAAAPPSPDRDGQSGAARLAAVIGVAAVAGAATLAGLKVTGVDSLGGAPGARALAQSAAGGTHGLYRLHKLQPVLDAPNLSDGNTISSAVSARRAYFLIASAGSAEVVAYDLRNGSQLWRSPLEADTSVDTRGAYVSVFHDVVIARYVLSDPIYRALDVASGRELWSRKGGWLYQMKDVLLHEDSVNGLVTAVDPATGNERWSRPNKTDWSLDVTGDDQAVLVQREGNPGALRLIDAETGAVFPESSQLPATGDRYTVSQGMVFVATGDLLSAYALSNVDQPTWTLRQADGRDVETVAPCGDHRICIDEKSGGEIQALDRASGQVVWTAAVPGHTVWYPDGQSVIVYAGGGDAGPQQTILIDAAGHVAGTFPDTLGSGSDGRTVLLFGGYAGDGRSAPTPIRAVDLSSGHVVDLGTASINPGSCGWDGGYLACQTGDRLTVWKYLN